MSMDYITISQSSITSRQIERFVMFISHKYITTLSRSLFALSENIATLSQTLFKKHMVKTLAWLKLKIKYKSYINTGIQ